MKVQTFDELINIIGQQQQQWQILIDDEKKFYNLLTKPMNWGSSLPKQRKELDYCVVYHLNEGLQPEFTV